jgi:hypothetical protein
VEFFEFSEGCLTLWSVNINYDKARFFTGRDGYVCVWDFTPPRADCIFISCGVLRSMPNEVGDRVLSWLASL